MSHQRSPLHLSPSEGLWVQGDWTSFSGPGPKPQAYYLWEEGEGTFPGRRQGAPSRAGSREEHLQGGVTLPCHSSGEKRHRLPIGGYF